ncbi:hypothetical protein [Mucilaginibacter myungsuensis]|uniref:Lipoprotein n=1 Tax=Mucilaginibacter myungsuensis TaxID=649104 RepID=A0A929L4Y5_9SPHI|nr:hypothetical protein [Mucilaginibacter myungsuensis]MBE9664095.1 hypothetical protein [Mucilaginibacter myungsuensis]MDN3601274.1 hypothetical protein [Mucilaginibacter myungsuensis]
MKPKLILSALALLSAVALAITSCNKGTTETPTPTPPVTSGTSTSIYYIDTFRIYSTDLSGGNRKLLIDEDLKSQNNYITSFSVMPGSGKLIYGYTTGYQSQPTIIVANADGTGKKVIKTLPAGISLNFVKGLPNDMVYYGTTLYNGATTTKNFYSIKADGTGEANVNSLGSFADVRESSIASSGNGVLSSGYFAKLKDGKFLEQESYQVLENETKADIVGRVILSADATKIAFLRKTATADKYEVRVKDIFTRGTSSTLAYTYTVPTTGPGAIPSVTPDISWVDGSGRLILSYGRFTFPRGVPSDYTYCVIIDPAKGTAGTGWSFTGDGYVGVSAN